MSGTKEMMHPCLFCLHVISLVRQMLARRRAGRHKPARAGGPRGLDSRRRDCQFTDTPSPSVLKHLLQAEGGAAE